MQCNFLYECPEKPRSLSGRPIKASHLIGHSPVGIWNQMFIALITGALTGIMGLIHQPSKKVGHFLSTGTEISFLLDKCTFERIPTEVTKEQGTAKGIDKRG